VINHQYQPPTPPFGKWRGERNHETSMSFPRKWESPTQPRQNKKRDARFREFDNDKMFVIVYTRHNARFFHPSLKRVARFFGSGDDQKSGNPVQICFAPTGRFIILSYAVTYISPRWGDDFLSLSKMVGEHFGKLSTSPIEPPCTKCFPPKKRITTQQFMSACFEKNDIPISEKL